MISVVIATYKEPHSIGKAIESLGKQLSKKDEILIIAPDQETIDAASKLKKKYNVKTIKEKAKNGKPAALNLGVSKARGDILLLTDGDVYVSDNAVKELMEKMKDKKVGAVSGRPVIAARNNMYDYWGRALYNVAHDRRVKALKNNKRIFCSGYLFVIRKSIFPKLDTELFSEDGYMSHIVYSKGYKIDYADRAVVYVKYPQNFNDWMKQKKRSVGGYNQMREMGINIRSFGQEASGVFSTFKYVNSIREAYWMFLLYLARVYLWANIYYEVNIKKKDRNAIWQVPESTK